MLGAADLFKAVGHEVRGGPPSQTLNPAPHVQWGLGQVCLLEPCGPLHQLPDPSSAE